MRNPWISAEFSLVTRDQWDHVRENKRSPADCPHCGKPLMEDHVRENKRSPARIGPRIHFDLDESWLTFNEVFKSFGEPLSLVFEGDYRQQRPIPGIQGGFVSPELACSIDKALFDEKTMRALAAELGLARQPQVKYRDSFYELKIAFRVAVRCGGALLVCGVGADLAAPQVPE